MIDHFEGEGGMRACRFNSPLVHLLGLVHDPYCLHSRLCLGAGMVLPSWEFEGTNPGKLAGLPALALVTFSDALMGCLSLTFVVALCRF